MSTRRLRTRRIASALIVPATILVASSALASGFATARFGGEHGNPTEFNPTALYYNPAGIAFGSGHRAMLDVNFAYRTTSYTRPSTHFTDPDPTPDEIAANSGEGNIENLVYAPFIGVVSDFGTDLPFAVGLAFYVPFGGASVWDKEEPVPEHPGAVDGPARWYATDGSITTFSLTLGAAYRIESVGLSFGLTGNLLFNSINTIRARNADGSDRLRADDGRLAEGRSWLDVSSTDFSMGVGVLYEPVENALWIGASYQSRPNFTGDMEMSGTLTNLLGVGEESVDQVTMNQTMPDVYRLGARYRPIERLELRLFGELVRWSAFEQQCITNNQIEGDAESVCEVGLNGAQLNDENQAKVVQNLIRRWNDAFGVRLGGSYWFSDEFELFVGGGYDSNAVPDESLEPALPDWDKFSAALGARLELGGFMAIMLTATNLFYLERDTSDVRTAERFRSVSRQPSSAGIYSQNIFLFNTNLEFFFE